MFNYNSEILKQLKNCILHSDEYNQDDQHIALFMLRFYYNPDHYFDKLLYPTDYNKYEMFVTNDMIAFLNCILYDKEFVKRLSLLIINNLRFLISNKIDHRYISSSLLNPSDDNKVKHFDRSTGILVHNRLGYIYQDLYNETVANQIIKQSFLERISNEKYDRNISMDEYTLEEYSVLIELRDFGYDEDYVRSVVLENQFIDIINKLLDENGLNKDMMVGAMEVLDLSIRIKEHRLQLFELHLINLFDKETIAKFNSKAAKETISRLTKTKTKVLKEEKYHGLKLV